jgi:hypothetical protein
MSQELALFFIRKYANEQKWFKRIIGGTISNSSLSEKGKVMIIFKKVL